MSKKWKKSGRAKPAEYSPGPTAAPTKGDLNMSNGMGNQEQVPVKLTPAQANDTLLKLIGRYDFYNGSVNAKAALLVAFNTFVAGGVVLKWKDIQDAFGSQKIAFAFVGLSLFVALVASLVSLWFTFKSVNPFLGSPSIPKNYHSLIFFGDVKKFAVEQYHEEVVKVTDDELRRDLAYQAHALADGLSGKFAALKWAVRSILFAQLPALGLLAVVYVIALLTDILPKITK
jgi:hypothetical protein